MQIPPLRLPVVPETVLPSAASDAAPGFAGQLGQAIAELSQSQEAAVAAERSYQLGQTGDLAGVMMRQQVADLGLQLAVNVRNKVIEAYKDIMNMPV